jgi:hypothetical protein
MTNCKNCESHFEGNFCNQCGQAAHTHPINFHFLWHDIQHGLFHFDNGVPYTIKVLFTRPGHAVREYIAGKRVRFFKPISLIILLASLYGVMLLYFNVKVGAGIALSENPKEVAAMYQFNDWLNKHAVASILLMLPFWTIGSYLAFKKQKYNFVEHFVLNAYISVQGLVIQLLLFPLAIYFQNKPTQILFVTVSGLIYLVVATWTYTQFFNKLAKIKSILYSLLAYFIMLSLAGVFGAAVGALLELFNLI